MIRKIQFCSITLLFFSISTLSQNSMQKHSQQDKNLMLNIYNQALQSCGNKNMNQGSWDLEYKCSQQNGGVHQICIEKIAQTTNKFSLNTGQTDWSTTRGSDNHCVCLGAWSLYVAKKNIKQIYDDAKKQLKCDAIPRIALTKNYVKNFSKNSSQYQGWQKWNGLQIQNQIADGVNQLFIQCSTNVNEMQLKQLTSNYCQFAKGITKLEESEPYLKYCQSNIHM